MSPEQYDQYPIGALYDRRLTGEKFKAITSDRADRNNLALMIRQEIVNRIRGKKINIPKELEGCNFKLPNPTQILDFIELRNTGMVNPGESSQELTIDGIIPSDILVETKYGILPRGIIPIRFTIWCVLQKN